MISNLQRGKIRASYFDLCIAARRIEDTAKFIADCTPQFKQALTQSATRIRLESINLRNLLTPAEKRDLDAIFPLPDGAGIAKEA